MKSLSGCLYALAYGGGVSGKVGYLHMSISQLLSTLIPWHILLSYRLN